MKIRTVIHPKIVTKGHQGRPNGFLVPIYNAAEGFFAPGNEPQQVYLTVVAPGEIKGPHLHFIRRGFFTCIKGRVRFVLRLPDGTYQSFWSGDGHGFLSIEVPTGVPAAIQNVGEEDAYVLNMPNPAWRPEMKDEHTADFSAFNFSQIE